MTATLLARRRLDFQQWPEVLADVDHLRSAGYQRTGNWDLSQILDHVGEGLRTAMQGTEHQGPWIIRKIFGPMLLPRILRQRRMKSGIKVPDWWLPGPTHDESQAVDRFRADVAAFERFSTPTQPHPFFGPMTKAQWNDLALIHAAHHLSFLVPNS
ncbi:MAG: DUF1569 domain-containing protein [Pirellulales bacterium]|nr:DUF1569 domain-containing protein [Pirellulales bacterium]